MGRAASIIRYPNSESLDSALVSDASSKNSDADITGDFDQDWAWNLQKAMEYLEDVDSDEAVEYLAKAILSWNESNKEIPEEIQRFIIRQSVRTIGLHDSFLNQERLDASVNSDQKKNITRLSSVDKDENVTTVYPLSTPPKKRPTEISDESGLLDAAKFAHMLDVSEHSLK